MKKIGNILWGLVFIAIGVIVLLNSLNVTNINVFFRGWWTLFIIIPSFIGIIKDDEKTWSIIFFLIGVALLLSCRGILEMALVGKCILPAILVVIGISLIFKDVIHSKVNAKVSEISSEDETYATFSGQKLDFTDKEFKGRELNAVFGGIDVNLKKAIIKEDVAIKVTAVFGGVDIIAPDGANINVESNSLFGGVSNKSTVKDEKLPTVYIKAMCIFGGVDIK